MNYMKNFCLISIFITSNIFGMDKPQLSSLIQVQESIYIEILENAINTKDYTKANKLIKDFKEENSKHTPMLIAAIENQWLRVFELLLQIPGIDVNDIDKDGFPAIAHTTYRGLERYSELLRGNKTINLDILKQDKKPALQMSSAQVDFAFKLSQDKKAKELNKKLERKSKSEEKSEVKQDKNDSKVDINEFTAIAQMYGFSSK